MTRLPPWTVAVFRLPGFVTPAPAEEKGAAPQPGDAPAADSCRRDVAPILKRHCVGCHTKNEPEGGLSLDTVPDFARGGKNGPAFRPGRPDESLAVQMVTGAKKPVMPHKQPPPSAAKIDVLRRWIAAGAKDDSLPAARRRPASRRPALQVRQPLAQPRQVVRFGGPAQAGGRLFRRDEGGQRPAFLAAVAPAEAVAQSQQDAGAEHLGGGTPQEGALLGSHGQAPSLPPCSPRPRCGCNCCRTRWATWRPWPT